MGFLKMTGCQLNSVRVLPASVLNYLGEQLAIDVLDIASIRALYRRECTLYELQVFAKALGLDLYPRLRRLKYQHLFVPKGLAVPDTLKPIMGPPVSLEANRRDWHAFVRLAASMQVGWCSVTMALRRYGSVNILSVGSGIVLWTRPLLWTRC